MSLSLHLGEGVLRVIEGLRVDRDLLAFDTLDDRSQRILILVCKSLRHDGLNLLAILQPR